MENKSSISLGGTTILLALFVREIIYTECLLQYLIKRIILIQDSFYMYIYL